MKLLLTFFFYLLISAAGFFIMNKQGIHYSDIEITIYALPMMLLLSLLTFFSNRHIKPSPAFIKYDGLRFIPYLTALVIVSIMLEAFFTGHFSVYLFSSLLLCLLIGYCEEGIFRRFMIGYLKQRRLNALLIILISSVLFASLHMVNVYAGLTVQSALSQSLSALPFGLCIGIIYYNTPRIWPFICVHLSTDFIGFTSRIHTFYFQAVPSLMIDAILLFTLLQIIWVKVVHRCFITKL